MVLASASLRRNLQHFILRGLSLSVYTAASRFSKASVRSGRVLVLDLEDSGASLVSVSRLDGSTTLTINAVIKYQRIHSPTAPMTWTRYPGKSTPSNLTST